MPISIKNDETEQLAREFAKETGERLSEGRDKWSLTVLPFCPSCWASPTGNAF